MVCVSYNFPPMFVDMLLVDPAFATCQTLKAARQQPRRRIPVDIVEKDDTFEVLADVPGVQKGDINLAVEHDTLTISVSHPDNTGNTPTAPAADAPATPVADAPEATGADKAAPPEDKAPKPKVLCRERRQRFAERALNFPETADLEAAQAECESGVLRISIPKKALPQPSRIHIA